MEDLSPIISSLVPALTELRHELHANPEPGYKEFQTAERMVRELEKLSGIEIKTGIAETGVVAVLGSEKSGPCVALRSDMDCLPIEEATGKSYASRRPGCMHACGHDGHMTCLLGAAMVLAQISDELSGPVKFIFQPAEEIGAGGKRMCEEGVLESPQVAVIFALHGVPTLPVGHIGIAHGAAMASCDVFRICVHGQGTHAAAPHLGVDPIVAASQIVTALQTIVSRVTDPLENAVVTVGQFHAGTSTNIIPDTAEIEGTVRTLSAEVRGEVISQIKNVAVGIAEGLGTRAEVEIEEGYPILLNDEQATHFVVNTAQEILGSEAVHYPFPAVMATEDFAYYAQQIPAAYWYLGLLPPGEAEYPMLHNSSFDFVDQAIPFGVRMHCEFVRRFMG